MVAAGLVGMICAVALLGWALRIEVLASVAPGSVTMKANTAIGLTAIATALVARASVPDRRLRRVAVTAATVALLLGALTIVEYGLSVDLHIDQLFFDEFPSAVNTSDPGRMAPNTALCLALMGWALLRFDVPERRGPHPANVAAVIVGIIALVAGVGYAMGVRTLHDIGPWTNMAIPTALAFGLVSTAAMAARPDRDVVAVLCSDGVAGAALRRLLPASIAGPLVLAGAATVIQRGGLMDSDLVVWLLINLLILLLTAGAWWLVTALDRIERERLAIAIRHDESERRFSAMADSAQDAIVIADPEGTITYANQAAHTMFCRTDHELQGSDLTELVPKRYRQAHIDGMRRFVETGGVELVGRTVDVTAVCADGKEFPAQISLSTWTAGGARSVVGVVRDVTRQKLFEAELERARDQALDASRLKSAFVANMSHELRTPLNGVLGMSELLATTPLSNQQERYNATLMKSARSLLRLVNEILDFADLEAGTLVIDRRPIAVRELVRQVVDDVTPHAADRHLGVDVAVDGEVPGRISADPLRLHQVLTHLVGNALKFTSDGRVSLHVDVIRADDGAAQLRFLVIDTGIGIEPDALTTIFAPFSQADVSSTRKYGGTGLGLTICQKLAEMMHGSVSATSEPGHGSTFMLALPLMPAPEAADEPTGVRG